MPSRCGNIMALAEDGRSMAFVSLSAFLCSISWPEESGGSSTVEELFKVC